MARVSNAWQRIAEAADCLADQYGVETPAVLRVVRGDVHTRRALRLNALADLLEELAAHPFKEIDGIGPEVARSLVLRGINTLEALRAVDNQVLLDIPGIGKATLERIRKQTAE
jgi:predicted flap endonuclease-1-like 5' DNA nuclease